MFGNGRYANVTATLALVIALGGTSYAAIKLPANSVGSKQIRKDAVTASKVKDGTLTKKDFGSGQLPAGPAGSAGPTGAIGSAGPAGATGPTGPKGDLAAVIGRSTVDASCNADTTGTPEICATLTTTFPQSGRVLLIGSGNWEVDGTLARGSCQFTIDGTPAPSVIARPGSSSNPSTTSVGFESQMSMNMVTDALAAGDHTFTVSCTEIVADIDWDDVQLSAVLLGAS